MVGAYVTSLDMNGISLSLLPLSVDGKLQSALLHPVSVDGWTAAKVFDPSTGPQTIPSLMTTTATSSTDDASTLLSSSAQEKLHAALSHLEKHVSTQLDEWDAIVGDGDCGRTVAKGARVCSDCVHASTVVRLIIRLFSVFCTSRYHHTNEMQRTGGAKRFAVVRCRPS